MEQILSLFGKVHSILL